MKQPEPFLPVDVVGSLVLESPDGVNLRVVAEKAHMVAHVDALPALLQLRRHFVTHGQQNIGGLLRLLRLSGLSVVLRFRGRQIARLGPTTRGTWTARLLGLAPADVKLSPILSSLLFRS